MKKNCFFIVLAVAIILASFVTGIAFGYEYPDSQVDYTKIAQLDYESPFFDSEAEAAIKVEFNASLMIIIWILGFLISAFFYFMHLHINNQNKIAFYLKNIGCSSGHDNAVNNIKVSHTYANSTSDLSSVGTCCSLCKKASQTLKPARYTNNNQTQYIKVCEDCFKTYKCEDLI